MILKINLIIYSSKNRGPYCMTDNKKADIVRLGNKIHVNYCKCLVVLHFSYTLTTLFITHWWTYIKWKKTTICCSIKFPSKLATTNVSRIYQPLSFHNYNTYRFNSSFVFVLPSSSFCAFHLEFTNGTLQRLSLVTLFYGCGG